MLGGIDKAIPAVHLADGAGLKKGVIREMAGLLFCGEQQGGPGTDGEHIRLQFQHHAALVGQAAKSRGDGRYPGGKAGIEPDPAVLIGEDTGVKGKGLPRPGAPHMPVRKPDMAVKLVFPGRGIADRHPHDAPEIKGIVQVIPAVRAAGHIRGVQAAAAGGIHRILVFAVDNPLIPPGAQILHRGGPAHIVIHTEQRPAEPVVGTVHIHTALKDIGFAVRDILPAREIGVHGLVHSVFLLSFLPGQAG